MNSVSMTARISAVQHMPFGPPREEAALALIREIEDSGPVTDLPYALFILVSSYTFTTRDDRAYVPFTKMVRLWDEHPEYFDEADTSSLLWSFKWMVSDLAEHPNVPMSQIEATLADMARRYSIAGQGMDAVEHQRFLWAWSTGAPGVEEAYSRWVQTPRDEFSQCEICDPAQRAAYLFDTNRIEQGIRIAETALEDSRDCSAEPAGILSRLQFAYLDVGRLADAVRVHRRAMAELNTEYGPMISAVARHIRFMAATRNPDQAIALLEQNQQFLDDNDPTPWVRLSFISKVGAAMHMMRSQGLEHRAIKLQSVPATTVGELDTWLKIEATSLAEVFDIAHSTTKYGAEIRACWTSEPLDDQVRLSLAFPLPPAVADAVLAPLADPQRGAESPLDRARRNRREAANLARVDPGRAAEQYASVSSAFLDLGLLVEAASCLGKAANLAADIGDHRSAAIAFQDAAALLAASGEGLAKQFSMTQQAIQSYAVLNEDDLALNLASAFMNSKAVTDALAGGSVTARAIGAVPAASPEPLDAQRAANTRLALQLQAVIRDLEARIHAQAGRFANAAAIALDAAERLAELDLISEAAHAFLLLGQLRYDNLNDPEGALWAYESAAEGFSIARDSRAQDRALGAATVVLRGLDRTTEADAMARRIGPYTVPGETN